MDGAQQEDHPSRSQAQFVVRQALIAILAALLAVGAIAVVSGDDGDGDGRALTPGADTTLNTATLDTTPVETATLDTALDATTIGSVAAAGEEAPAITVPLDTNVVENQGSAALEPAGGATATSVLGPIVTTPPVGLPSIDATAYAVYDATDGTWLAASEADTPMPVGSVMKLLTSYVVLEAGDPSKIVTVPALQLDIEESAIGLYEGEQLPRDVLMRAMLIVSANDAARALAIDVGGSTEGFVEQMNAAARQLGLANTVAANPIGLDAAGAHSSAHDMISLAALLLQDQTFREAVAKTSATLHGQTFSATNTLLTSYDGATGVKTGHTTQAGYCLIGSATRGGRSLIVAVLGAPSDAARLQQTTALLDWGFAQV